MRQRPIIISGIVFIFIVTIVLMSILPENLASTIGILGFGTLFIFALLLMTYFIPRKIFRKAKQQRKQKLALFVIIPGILLGLQWWRAILLRKHGVISFAELYTADIIQGAITFFVMSGIMNAVWLILGSKDSAGCTKSQIQPAAKNAEKTQRTPLSDLTLEEKLNYFLYNNNPNIEEQIGDFAYPLGIGQVELAIALLVNALKGYNWEVKSKAIKICGIIGSFHEIDEKAIEILSLNLMDSQDEVRCETANALRDMVCLNEVSEQLQESLSKALEDSCVEVRLAIAETFGIIAQKKIYCQDKENIPFIKSLTKASGDQDERVRKTAKEALEKITTVDSAIGDLMKIIEKINSDKMGFDGDDEDAMEIARWLIMTGDKRVIKPIILLASSLNVGRGTPLHRNTLLDYKKELIKSAVAIDEQEAKIQLTEAVKQSSCYDFHQQAEIFLKFKIKN